MFQRCRLLLIPACLLALAGSASAQVKDDRIIFGHLHLHPSNLDAHKKFWETLGGQIITFGNNIGAVKFPLDWTPSKGLGPTINLTSASYTTPPTGGTKGTSVPHVGFSVPDLRAVLARVKAGGYTVVSERPNVMVMSPDDILVELVEVPSQKTPFAMHHIHFAGPNAAEMAAWYEKVFGAKRKTAGGTEAAVYLSSLIFETSAAPVAGTKGTALDHIGFEVRDLVAFTKELETMGIKLDRNHMTAKLPDLGPIGVAFLTDPWGTSIELNEGYRAQ